MFQTDFSKCELAVFFIFLEHKQSSVAISYTKSSRLNKLELLEQSLLWSTFIRSIKSNNSDMF